jgi:hypothetical protein
LVEEKRAPIGKLKIHPILSLVEEKRTPIRKLQTRSSSPLVEDQRAPTAPTKTHPMPLAEASPTYAELTAAQKIDHPSNPQNQHMIMKEEIEALIHITIKQILPDLIRNITSQIQQSLIATLQEDRDSKKRKMDMEKTLPLPNGFPLEDDPQRSSISLFDISSEMIPPTDIDE